uniref:NADH-ubiquinone oxidoreductase chain 3 n=1 Tax=Japanagallia turriformis TaxID=3071388 RepID=A0AA50KVY9_9HEMI|nr:NADH dehydrogenase subunit 3 [Japanagallia turriformis]WMC21082.1 NADH dehydrogenase subunit 3 [Japanagallia turriformis]
MYLTLFYMLMIFLITIMLTLMIMLISKKMIIDKQKSSPFECGFNPMSNKRLPFSIHFFLIAVLFLIFDIEIIIIMPMIFSLKFVMLKSWMLSSYVVLITLLVGLYNEWFQGMLKWTN